MVSFSCSYYVVCVCYIITVHTPQSRTLLSRTEARGEPAHIQEVFFVLNNHATLRTLH